MNSPSTLRNEIRPLLGLALPFISSGLVQAANWFFQSLFLAHLGGASLAAGALVSWLYITLIVIALGTLSSINILISHNCGANNEDSVSIIIRDGFWLAVMLSIPIILILRNITPILELLDQPVVVIKQAGLYMRALSWGVMADFVVRACLGAISAIGRVRVMFIFSVLSATTNVFISGILVFGIFGLPALGVEGAGWGMAIANILLLGTLVTFISRDAFLKKRFSKILSFDKNSHLGEMITIGLPMGFMHCTEVAFFFTLTLAVGIIGVQSQAANQVSLQFLNLMMCIIFSLAQSISIRMSYLLGAKKTNEAQWVSIIGTGFACGMMSVVALLYWFFPLTIISFDININHVGNSGIVSEIRNILAIAAVFQIIEAARISLFGALRSIKDTKYTLYVSFLSFWCISLPLGYIFSMFMKMGVTGYWWAMVIGASVGVSLLIHRLSNAMKKIHEENQITTTESHVNDIETSCAL